MRNRLKKMPAPVKLLLALLLAGTLIFSAALCTVLAGSHSQVTGSPQIMVILGCKVEPWGPSILLRDRLDTALAYLADHPDMMVVVSGGQGGDEPVAEAVCMADYLISRGIHPSRILQEDQSHNTHQNLVLSLALLKEAGYDVTDDVLVVSNGFHLARTRMLWGRVAGSGASLSTLAAPTSHRPSRLAMYVREPLALMKSYLFDRNSP